MMYFVKGHSLPCYKIFKCFRMNLKIPIFKANNGNIIKVVTAGWSTT